MYIVQQQHVRFLFSMHTLGSMTPTSKSPSSAAVTPVNIFGNDELADILRASPGIDLSKLQIKQEPVSMLENEQ